MSLFKNKCPNPSCGFENDSGAKFCSRCGTPLVSTCPKCGTEVAPGSRYCSKCGTEIIAFTASKPVGESSKEMGYSRQWVRKEGEFARQFEERDLKGIFKKGVTVEKGTVALFKQGGAFKGALQPGYYNLGNIFTAHFPIKLEERTEVIIVDSGEIPLQFGVPKTELRTGDNINIGVFGEVAAQLRDPELFLDNYFKGKEFVSFSDFEKNISLTVKSIIKTILVKYTAEEIYGNANLNSEFEQVFKTKINDIFKATGLEIIRLTYIDYDEGKWNELRAVRGDRVFSSKMGHEENIGARDDLQKNKERRDVINAYSIDEHEGNIGVKRALRDIDNQYNDEGVAYDRAKEISDIQHGYKVEDLLTDRRHSTEEWDLEHKHHIRDINRDEECNELEHKNRLGDISRDGGRKELDYKNYEADSRREQGRKDFEEELYRDRAKSELQNERLRDAIAIQKESAFSELYIKGVNNDLNNKEKDRELDRALREKKGFSDIDEASKDRELGRTIKMQEEIDASKRRNLENEDASKDREIDRILRMKDQEEISKDKDLDRGLKEMRESSDIENDSLKKRLDAMDESKRRNLEADDESKQRNHVIDEESKNNESERYIREKKELSDIENASRKMEYDYAYKMQELKQSGSTEQLIKDLIKANPELGAKTLGERSRLEYVSHMTEDQILADQAKTAEGAAHAIQAKSERESADQREMYSRLASMSRENAKAREELLQNNIRDLKETQNTGINAVCNVAGAKTAVQGSATTILAGGLGTPMVVNTTTSSRVCPKCGATIPAGSNFCPNCGGKL